MYNKYTHSLAVHALSQCCVLFNIPQPHPSPHVQLFRHKMAVSKLLTTPNRIKNYFRGTFCRTKIVEGINLTTHLHLALRLRTHGGLPPLSYSRQTTSHPCILLTIYIIIKCFQPNTYSIMKITMYTRFTPIFCCCFSYNNRLYFGLHGSIQTILTIRHKTM